MRISDWSSDVCSSDLTLTATPANLVGRLLLATGFLERTAKTFGALAAEANRYAAGAAPTPFRFVAPKPDADRRRRVDRLVAEIEASGHGNGLAARLAALLLSAQDKIGRANG